MAKSTFQCSCRFLTNSYLREEAPNSHVVEQRVEWQVFYLSFPTSLAIWFLLNNRLSFYLILPDCVCACFVCAWMILDWLNLPELAIKFLYMYFQLLFLFVCKNILIVYFVVILVNWRMYAFDVHCNSFFPMFVMLYGN